MDITRIVFTGGPCAGKTTLIKKAKKYLKEKGYNVIVIPEAATILKETEIQKLQKSSLDFQKCILKMQLLNEKMALNAAKNNKVIILHDRGILDNKAYCENSNCFDMLLNKDKVSEIDKLDSYDLVFDLITTADCDPSKYTLENNDQREESIEDAKIIDKRTSNAWMGHTNIKVLNSNISIDESFELIKKEIDSLLNQESKKEINKHIIDNKIEDFKNYNDNNSRLIKVQEINLISPKENINYRLHKRTYKNNSTFIFNVSKEENNIVTTYCNKKISLENYLDLITKYKINNINHYNLLSFIENRQIYNIKFYEDYTLLEYEQNKLNNELIIPNIIKIIDDDNKNKRLLKK